MSIDHVSDIFAHAGRIPGDDEAVSGEGRPACCEHPPGDMKPKSAR